MTKVDRFEMVFSTETEAEKAFDELNVHLAGEAKESLILFSDMVNAKTGEVVYRVRYGNWENPIK